MVDNVQGAQRELMKYWSRVSGNRWLVAKMFGVLMVGFHSFQLFITSEGANPSGRSSFCFGFLLQGNWNLSGCCCISDGVWACIILWHQMIGSGFHRLLWIRRARLRHLSIEGYKACGIEHHFQHLTSLDTEPDIIFLCIILLWHGVSGRGKFCGI